MYGPHSGTGNVEVADWWLGRTVADLGVTAAAAALATTTDRTKTRMATFTMVTSF